MGNDQSTSTSNSSISSASSSSNCAETKPKNLESLKEDNETDEGSSVAKSCPSNRFSGSLPNEDINTGVSNGIENPPMSPNASIPSIYSPYFDQTNETLYLFGNVNRGTAIKALPIGNTVTLEPSGLVVRAPCDSKARHARHPYHRRRNLGDPNTRMESEASRRLVHEVIYKMGGYILNEDKQRVKIEPNTPMPPYHQTKRWKRNRANEDQGNVIQINTP